MVVLTFCIMMPILAQLLWSSDLPLTTISNLLDQEDLELIGGLVDRQELLDAANPNAPKKEKKKKKEGGGKKKKK